MPYVGWATCYRHVTCYDVASSLGTCCPDMCHVCCTVRAVVYIRRRSGCDGVPVVRCPTACHACGLHRVVARGVIHCVVIIVYYWFCGCFVCIMPCALCVFYLCWTGLVDIHRIMSCHVYIVRAGMYPSHAMSHIVPLYMCSVSPHTPPSTYTPTCCVTLRSYMWRPISHSCIVGTTPIATYHTHTHPPPHRSMLHTL